MFHLLGGKLERAQIRAQAGQLLLVAARVQIGNGALVFIHCFFIALGHIGSADIIARQQILRKPAQQRRLAAAVIADQQHLVRALHAQGDIAAERAAFHAKRRQGDIQRHLACGQGMTAHEGSIDSVFDVGPLRLILAFALVAALQRFDGVHLLL